MTRVLFVCFLNFFLIRNREKSHMRVYKNVHFQISCIHHISILFTFCEITMKPPVEVGYDINNYVKDNLDITLIVNSNPPPFCSLLSRPSGKDGSKWSETDPMAKRFLPFFLPELYPRLVCTRKSLRRMRMPAASYLDYKRGF